MPKLTAGAYQVLIQSSSANEYLLAFIAQRAFELRAVGLDAALREISPLQVVMAKGRFMDVRRPALLQHLESYLAPGDGYVPAARMKAIVGEFGERVSNRELSRYLEMLGASRVGMRIDGQKARVWSGVQERDVEDAQA